MLIEVVCLALFAAFSMCELLTYNSAVEMYAYGSYVVEGVDAQPVWIGTSILAVCLSVLVAASALLLLVNIFLFKHRSAQLSILFAEYVFIIGAIGFTVAYILKYIAVLKGVAPDGDVVFSPGWSLSMPVVAFIFNMLAVRGVAHDEMLVRAADRVR